MVDHHGAHEIESTGQRGSELGGKESLSEGEKYFNQKLHIGVEQ